MPSKGDPRQQCGAAVGHPPHQLRSIDRALRTRLTAMVGQLFSQSKLAKAINYALDHWDGLTLFFCDGRVEVDSNTVERSMRQIVMGRRNSLFSESEGGAEGWAILASLVNTGTRPGGLPDRCAGAHRVRANQEPSAARAAHLGTGRRRAIAPHRLLHERARRPKAASLMASAAMTLAELEGWLLARVDGHPAATSIPSTVCRRDRSRTGVD
ncbi:hypothetical protein ACVW1C_005934 [Bradyrhizobium sp. USDA 4011]